MLIVTGWVGVLTLAGVAWPPYTAVAAALIIPCAALFIGRPDWAFALFFAIETMFSEDVLLVTEQLEQTIYRIPLPYMGLNGFELILLILVLATLLQRRGVIRRTALDSSLFLFGAACLLGYLSCILFYHDPARLFEPRRLLHFFIAYFLTVNLIRTKSSLRVFLTLFFLAVCLKALQGVYLYTAGSGLLIKWKIRAIFTGWADSLCFVTFLLMFGAFWIEKIHFPGKRFFSLMVPVVAFSFLFSYKRAYYVAIAAGIAALFWVQGGKSRFRMIQLVFIGVLVFILLISITGQWQAIGMRVESILNPTKESSANYRLVEWRNAMISIRHNPLLGIGLGGVMPMEIWLSRTNLLGVHNTFLWAAVKMGVLGFFSLCLIHAVFLQHLFRQNKILQDPFLRTVSRGAACVFIAFTAAEMFAPMFAQMRTAAWFGIILGIGMLLKEMDEFELESQNTGARGKNS
ncbi:MAG: O-antigen ligase family protein [Candidatus Omnitrophica bacterium]|nr:O-antigen ligase family protein [Candidatus Omnitrophota bacterium]